MSIAGALKATLEEQRVVAVVTIERATDALPLADALCAGGVRVIEITLRSDAARAAIEAVAKARPEASVGAGTVRDARSLRGARD
ncbi:MAG TPA: keto-deoxy-phosphogluconate aldolase, partial [Gammaproteobacteria bacterium]|nr:keto-deoxy-phosphogluconate aldolase [Gammaproteobacteria bacterium]